MVSCHVSSHIPQVTYETNFYICWTQWLRCLTSGISTEFFFKGGNAEWCRYMYQAITRGVWGHASPEKILSFALLKLLLVASETTFTCYDNT